MAAVTAQALGRGPAVTRSSQQRGSAPCSRAPPPASHSAPEELRRRCSMAVLRLQMLGRPKGVTPFHLSGDSHINLAEEQAHYRI
jgi:hypothetical protein